MIVAAVYVRLTVVFVGALDGLVVEDRGSIEWHDVVPFAPFLGSSDNSSTYLQWALVLNSISVRTFLMDINGLPPSIVVITGPTTEFDEIYRSTARGSVRNQHILMIL